MPLSLWSILALSAVAQAQDAVKLEVVRKGQAGGAPPGLIVIPQVDAKRLDVDLSCGGASAQHRGGARRGQRVQLDLAAELGTHSCKGTLSIETMDGESGQMPLSFQVEVVAGMKVNVLRDRIDLQKRSLELTLDRPAGKVEVKVYGLDGGVVGQGAALSRGTPAGQPIQVEWAGPGGEVLRMEVLATDADGFTAGVQLFPWYYEIPHEDVVFESNQAVIRPSEEMKLRSALAEAQKVVARYGAFATVNLYVGGYTDTVGNGQSNLFLSEKRAAAIARWFRQNGFQGEIWFQGFGERGLAVPTPDEVDEARNRRSVYVVAAEPPPVTSAMPGAEWKKL